MGEDQDNDDVDSRRWISCPDVAAHHRTERQRVESQVEFRVEMGKAAGTSPVVPFLENAHLSVGQEKSCHH